MDSMTADLEGETMKLTTLVVGLILFAFSAALANGPSDLPEKFMKQLLAGNGSEAADAYFATNPLTAQKTQLMQLVKTQIEGAIKIYGKPSSYELAFEDDLAPSLKRYVYISKHDYLALAWEFYCYRPKDEWIAASMNFNDNFTLLERKK